MCKETLGKLLKKRLKHARCLQSESVKKLLVNVQGCQLHYNIASFTDRNVMTWLQEEKNILGTCRQYSK